MEAAISQQQQQQQHQETPVQRYHADSRGRLGGAMEGIVGQRGGHKFPVPSCSYNQGGAARSRRPLQYQGPQGSQGPLKPRPSAEDVKEKQMTTQTLMEKLHFQAD